MIVKVDFGNHSMLFGNSYRTWEDQLAEHYREFGLRPISILMCKKDWISFGGLKWCQDIAFQRELDKEGKGREIDDFVFEEANTYILNKLYKVLL